MAEAKGGGVIQQFLVAIGYKVDKKSQYDVEKSIEAVEDKFDKFSTAIHAVIAGTVATTIFNTISATADKFDQLADAANRIGGGATVQGLSSFSYAVQLAGGSAEGALQSYESLNRSIGQAANGIGRAAPIFKQLGISLRDSEGNVKSVDQVWQELGKTLQGMSRAEQAGIISRLGLSADMVESLTMEASAFNQLRDEYNKMYADVGLDFNAVADAAADFNDNLDKLLFQVEVIRDAVGAKFLSRFSNSFNAIRRYIGTNISEIVNTIGTFLDILFDAVDVLMVFVKGIISGSLAIFKVFNRMLDWFNELGDVWKNVLLAMGAAWLAFNSKLLRSPLGIIFSLITAIGLLYDDFKTWQRGGKSFIDWNNTFWKTLVSIVSNDVVQIIAGMAMMGAAIFKFAGGLQGIVGTILSVSKVFGTLIKVIRLFSLTLLTTPIGWIILAITALIAIGIALYKNWDTIKAHLISVWNNITSAIANAKENIVAIWNSITSGISELWDTAVNWVVDTFNQALDNITSVIQAIQDAFYNIPNVVDEVINFISTAWDNFINYLASAPDRIKDAFLSLLCWIKNIVPQLLSGAADAAKGMWNSVVDILPDSIADKLKFDTSEEPVQPPAGAEEPPQDSRPRFMVEREQQRRLERANQLPEAAPSLDDLANVNLNMAPAQAPGVTNNNNTNNNVTNNSSYNITINAANNPQETANAVYNKLNTTNNVERNGRRGML